MSLDKAIAHGKEKRKPYHGSKAIDPSCRNHGGGRKYACPWCAENRKYKFRDKHPPEFDIACDMNRKKRVFLTADQIESLGGRESAESLADGHEIIEIPNEWEGE